MRIDEIADLQSIADKSQTDALNRQAKQIKIKKAKLSADQAQQKMTKTRERLRKVQASPLSEARR